MQYMQEMIMLMDRWFGTESEVQKRGATSSET